MTRKLELFPDIHATISGRIPNCTALHSRLDELESVHRVVVACAELSEDLLETLLPACRLHGVKLTVVPPTRGIFGTATHLGHVADLPLLDYNTWYVSPSTLALKRIFDVVTATFGLIVASPLFLLIGLAILVDGGRPVLFRQLRAGENGRSLPDLQVPDDGAERGGVAPGARLARGAHATRCSSSAPTLASRASGAPCARMSLDELPQLLNVLRGEMSIVGPRPEFVDLVEQYTPEHEFRLQLKPGITGPMQVYGRGELTFAERLAVEREYIENLSLGRDFRIILMTIPAVFGRRGAF